MSELYRQTVEISWKSPDEKPPSSDWYCALLRPANYAEIDDEGRDWSMKFGFQTIWHNKFTNTWWGGNRRLDHRPINDRLIAWAHKPELPREVLSLIIHSLTAQGGPTDG